MASKTLMGVQSFNGMWISLFKKQTKNMTIKLFALLLYEAILCEVNFTHEKLACVDFAVEVKGRWSIILGSLWGSIWVGKQRDRDLGKKGHKSQVFKNALISWLGARISCFIGTVERLQLLSQVQQFPRGSESPTWLLA